VLAALRMMNAAGARPPSAVVDEGRPGPIGLAAVEAG
jgi:hypothetical protein